jgi:hypothetical protein
MIIIYTTFWLACSVGLCLFGFFVGRCARKLPIIDSKLPWTLGRDQVMSSDENRKPTCEHMLDKPSWPENPM